MKSLNIKSLLFFLGLALTVASCSKSTTAGTKVKEPFTGNKYESSNRYFRAVGKGTSQDDNIAKNKADLQAKKELAQQVETRMKVVTDQYLAETETNNGSELNDKFQSLIREVTNTQIADLRKIGEEKYKDTDGKFTVYIAYEIHKKDMLRFMKKQAKLDAKINEIERKAIEEILDEEIQRIEALGDGE
ncbi:MAG: hypothetical protein R2809_01370 [Flavobacteriales bacterium]